MGNATRNVTVAGRPAKQKYTVIIPGAGLGTRMKSYGAKPLIKIGNKTIIERQLDVIGKSLTLYETILVTGYENQRIKRYVPDYVKLINNESYEQTSVVHSIALGLSIATTENVLIIYGDLVFNSETLLAPLDKESLVFLDPSSSMKDSEAGCVTHSGYVQNFMYDLPEKWAQITYITGNELKLLKRNLVSSNCSRLLGFEMLNKIIEQGGKFKAFRPHNGKITDVDSNKDIVKAEEICQK